MSDNFETYGFSEGITYRGSIERYEASDVWANAIDRYDGIVDAWYGQINKYHKMLDEIEESIDDTWSINYEEDYFLDRKYNLRKKSKKSKKNRYKLARPELMAPAQQTIDSRWDDVKNRFLSYEDLNEKISLRDSLSNGLGNAAFAGFCGGTVGGGMTDLIANVNSPIAMGVIAGSAGVAGATATGYGVFRSWGGRSKKQRRNAAENYYSHVDQLTEEQARVVWNTCTILHYTGGELDHWADDVTHEEIRDSVSVIGDVSIDGSVIKLLKWIDKASFDKAERQQKDVQPASDKEWSLHYLSTTSTVIDSAGIDSTFHLIDKAGKHQAPLAVLALVRMDRRSSFMSDYAKEFAYIHDKWRELADLSEESMRLKQSQTVIGGQGEYFNLRLADVEQQRDQCMKEMALMDLRIAALAYAYQRDAEGLAKIYQPIETHDFHTSQLELWQMSMDELCQMPMRELPAPMADVMLRTMNNCLGMEQDGQFGRTAQQVVAYVQKIATSVNDEGAATEALRHIDNLLVQQKAIK